MMDSRDQKELQTTRAWAGVLVVLIGDLGIALSAILIALHLKMGTESVAILTSAFTAIASITTAYFGIRAAANTAQSAVAVASRDGQGSNKTPGNPPLTK
ncbi:MULTISPECIES: hypothetical protein [unclassified Streptomyces]|uniref:hypothetical protein n=1 Tax=unclassified Streptomyces TaxID=2593676 RepID=UPI002E282943|nr:hypothetical protein [Streptomyces sp. NBC_01439]